MWKRENLGFLPSSNPLFSLSLVDFKNVELAFKWENLCHMIPYYIQEECVREEIIYLLRTTRNLYCNGFVESLGSSNYERAFLILTYLATVYINAPEGKKKSKLPQEISLPLVSLSNKMSRLPVIDYTSFVLYNWKPKNQLENFIDIDIINTFTDSKDEQILISTLIEMEYLGRLLSNDIVVNLETIASINDLLQSRLPSIKTEFFDTLVDDYENLLYEQCSPERLNYHCAITLQSPILSFFCKYLDVSFQEEYLRRLNRQIVLQRPKLHNHYLDSVTGIRYFSMRDKYLKDGYNECLSELIRLYKNLSIRKRDNVTFSLIEKELNRFYL